MNKHLYRKVYSKRLGAVVPVAEILRNQRRSLGKDGDDKNGPAELSVLGGALLAATTLFSLSGTAKGQVVTWQGTSSDDWSTGGNWSSGKTPDNATDIVVNAIVGANPTPALHDGAAFANSLTIGDGATGQVALGAGNGGSARLDVTDSLVIGSGAGGTGAMTLAGGATLDVGVLPNPGDANGIILLGTDAGSSGALNFGAAAGQAAQAAGALNAAGIVFGAGAGDVVFNHAGSLAFDTPISGVGAIDVFAGVTTIGADNSAGFSHERVSFDPTIDDFITELETFSAAFGGSTNLHGGTLILASNGALGVSAVHGIGDATLGYGVNGLSIANAISVDAGATLSLLADTGVSATQSGVISGAGTIEKTGAGTLTLSGNNRYAGATTVTAGALRAGAANAFSAASAVTVAANATLDLGGFSQTMAALNNKGLVSFGNATAPGAVLAVSGDYVGNGGAIDFNTALGGSGSATDKMVVTGSVSGITTVVISNAGGLGAQTTGNGIELIDVQGSSANNAFTLGGARVAAGAYDYLLYQGGQAGTAAADDGNWYLRSQADAYRPEVVVDAAIPALASRVGLAMLGTWHERSGGEFSANQTIDDDYPIAGWARVLDDNGTQGQGYGSDAARQSAQFARHGSSFDYRVSGVQAGVDVLRGQSETGARNVAGLYVGGGNAHADVDAVVDNGYGHKAGQARMNAYSIGGYFTHIGADDWYVDTVLQGTRYSNARGASFAAQSQTLKTAGQGLVASMEAGYPFALGQDTGLHLEPQAQLVYQHQTFNQGADAFGQVAFASSSAAYARLGARLSKDWTRRNGRKTTAWVRVGMWNSFGDKQAKTTVTTLAGNDPATVATDMGSDRWGQADAGVSSQLGVKVSLFVSGDYSAAMGNGSGHAWGGNAGVKIALGAQPPSTASLPPPPMRAPGMPPPSMDEDAVADAAPDASCPSTPYNVFFEGDGADIAAAAAATLEYAVTQFRHCGAAQVQVVGFADASGHPDPALSQRRADAMKAYMASRGVPYLAFNAQGQGELDLRIPDDGIARNGAHDHRAAINYGPGAGQ